MKSLLPKEEEFKKTTDKEWKKKVSRVEKEKKKLIMLDEYAKQFDANKYKGQFPFSEKPSNDIPPNAS